MGVYELTLGLKRSITLGQCSTAFHDEVNVFSREYEVDFKKKKKSVFISTVTVGD